MEARCQCGQLSVALPGPSASVVACHCGYCQRRSGSPFGVLAYYPDESVTITGEATRYARPTAAGGTFETFFCPTCGSTVYARAGKHPTKLGISVGAICDPGYPAPVRSAWEEGKHAWVVIPEPAEHYPRGRS
ncbi:GFA family protein [Methylobacterium planeticum]